MKGTRALTADRWATAARSMHSWTQEEASWAKPVWRQAITSEWSPKMEKALVPTVRAATWMTPGRSWPEIRYRGGTISIRPWLAV